MSDGNLLCSFPPVTQFNYGCKAVLSSRFTAFHKQTQLKNLGEGNFGTIGKITCQLSGLVPVRQQENVGRTRRMKKLTEKKTKQSNYLIRKVNCSCSKILVIIKVVKIILIIVVIIIIA